MASFGTDRRSSNASVALMFGAPAQKIEMVAASLSFKAGSIFAALATDATSHGLPMKAVGVSRVRISSIRSPGLAWA
ncbi:hypothetical protein CSC82_05545 [Rhodobacteraceae bacterium 4F10]|nr:hypothetical protein CSC82_05545 [Rhodobacteraceae bacterium 4F10]